MIIHDGSSQDVESNQNGEKMTLVLRTFLIIQNR